MQKKKIFELHEMNELFYVSEYMKIELSYLRKKSKKRAPQAVYSRTDYLGIFKVI